MSMFSQLRQAVETFAPQPRRSTDEAPSYEHDAQHSPSTDSNRPTSPLSSTQLAESALSTLRKSFASQRPDSPGPSPRRASRDTHLSLEDRLRASFTIGEASATPNNSMRASPAPAPTDEHSLSPTFIPLPQSPPPLENVTDATQPLATSLPSIIESEPVSAASKTEAVPQETSTAEEKARETSEVESVEPPPSQESGISTPHVIIDVDFLQERLKLIEQRFSDVSKSFKRLQAEKLAADAILRELTPLEGFNDVDALRDFFNTIKGKTEMSQEEIVRLTGKIAVQDERLEEIRDMHRLETKSQSDQIETLKSRLHETEALYSASQSSVSQNEEAATKHKVELDKLRTEVAKSMGMAKEEEEKRVKAISLLKTVRQKLVKAEKEKEDAQKEIHILHEQERIDREKEVGEKNRLRREIDTVSLEREKAVAGLRAQFDKEIALLKDRQEKELIALRGQFELEAVTTKGSYTRDLAAKTTQLSHLQTTLGQVTQDKNTFFDQLQLRQAEVESSQSHLESIQSQNTELQYQLREMEDRVALLQEELAEAQSGQMIEQSQEQGVSSAELARVLAATESKYETRIAELQRNLAVTERERNDTEAEWSRKLREKTKETDDLKHALGSTAKLKEQDQDVVDGLQREIELLRKERVELEQQREDIRFMLEQAKENEAIVRSSLAYSDVKIKAQEQQVEEFKSREAQLRHNNKTLREELRKVQSSAALLEKQRNPGVGYWQSKGNGNGSQTDIRPSASSDSLARTDSSASDTAKNDEDINMEYLRNVILQFLEHKEMRPNLVKVLSIIMRFTPQETRRLMAKV